MEEAEEKRSWDSVADVQMIGRYGKTFAKLHSISKPTVAAALQIYFTNVDDHNDAHTHFTTTTIIFRCPAVALRDILLRREYPVCTTRRLHRPNLNLPWQRHRSFTTGATTASRKQRNLKLSSRWWKMAGTISTTMTTTCGRR